MGEQFGPYELLRSVAHGGMAEVFLAQHLGKVGGFSKQLAIKRIYPHLASDPDLVSMFIDEARIAARLNHPNIVQIYDLGQLDEYFYIAMEFVNGCDLRSLCERGLDQGNFLPIELSCRILADAAAGLHYAHSRLDDSGQPMNIIHRDVSPQNILVGMNGSVKMCDFGIAKAEKRLTHTRAGQFKGKFAYMSPEQIDGASDDLDARSDVFSLGIVLYEVTTISRLFRGQSDFETIKMVTDLPIILPTDVRQDFPPGLEPIVMKALARDPDERFQSADQLQLALEEWLLDERAKATPLHLSRYMNEILHERADIENSRVAPLPTDIRGQLSREQHVRDARSEEEYDELDATGQFKTEQIQSMLTPTEQTYTGDGFNTPAPAVSRHQTPVPQTAAAPPEAPTEPPPAGQVLEPVASSPKLNLSFTIPTARAAAVAEPAAQPVAPRALQLTEVTQLTQSAPVAPVAQAPVAPQLVMQQPQQARAPVVEQPVVQQPVAQAPVQAPQAPQVDARQVLAGSSSHGLHVEAAIPLGRSPQISGAHPSLNRPSRISAGHPTLTRPSQVTGGHRPIRPSGSFAALPDLAAQPALLPPAETDPGWDNGALEYDLQALNKQDTTKRLILTCVGLAAILGVVFFVLAYGGERDVPGPKAPVVVTDAEVKEAPVAPLDRRSMSISSDPEGARVLINGQLVEQDTPFEGELVEDEVNEILFMAPGYKTRRVMVRPEGEARTSSCRSHLRSLKTPSPCASTAPPLAPRSFTTGWSSARPHTSSRTSTPETSTTSCSPRAVTTAGPPSRGSPQALRTESKASSPPRPSSPTTIASTSSSRSSQGAP